jgi:hypothetical protein
LLPVEEILHADLRALQTLHLAFELWCRRLLMVDCRIKVRLDLQADKSPVVVKGLFFP